jgi:hypothetical protein
MLLKQLAKNWFPPLIFALGTIVMTWPLSAHLATSVIGWANGDNVYYVWLLGWFRKALFELHQNPLVVPSLNSPVGWHLAYSEITLANVFMVLPVVWLGNPILAYNMALLLSFVLSGWIVYLWVKSFTHSTGAALIAGALFAFAPYRFAHSYGHLPLMGTQWLALNFAGLHFLLPQRSLNWKYAALAGLGLGLAGLSSMYYLYMTALLSGIFIGGYVLLAERSALARASFWRNLAAYAAIALPFLLVALAPYLQLALMGETDHRPLAQVDVWSASPTDFLLPSPLQFLWGSWIYHHFDRSLWIEQLIYLGLVAIALTGVAWGKRKRISEYASSLRIFGWVGMAAIILALGTTLHWNNQPVLIHIPGFLQSWLPYDQVPVPLPGWFLMRILPFYDGMRVWMRYGIYASLFIALSAGLGWLALSRIVQTPWIKNSALLVILLLIGIDFYQGPMPIVTVTPRPVDVWLTSQPDIGPVAYFPASMNDSPAVIYGSLINNKRLLGMFYGAYYPKNYEAILPTLQKFPDRSSVALLRDKGIGYVIVDASQYADWDVAQQSLHDLGLVCIYAMDGQYVYTFRP